MICQARLWITLLLWGWCATVMAENQPIEAFYGQYIGNATSDAEIERDMSVTIGPTSSGGFFVDWATVSHKPKGMSRKDYRVKFLPSQRENIYSSAMQTNVFGGKISLDPLKGDPYVWARIKGSTLTVHSMTITADGGYEVQIYNRTLNSKGLWLEYRRLRSGEPLRQVSTQLIKIAD